jgi:hypothetical protein
VTTPAAWRTAEDPDAVLLTFLQSTYDATATTARWDRDALERQNGTDDELLDLPRFGCDSVPG